MNKTERINASKMHVYPHKQNPDITVTFILSSPYIILIFLGLVYMRKFHQSCHPVQTLLF